MNNRDLLADLLARIDASSKTVDDIKAETGTNNSTYYRMKRKVEAGEPVTMNLDTYLDLLSATGHTIKVVKLKSK